MISMQAGLAAIASLNWAIIVSGAQAENCAFRSTPNASAACAAPVCRASVAPSPGLPPICMYMTKPLPIGSAAEAGADSGEQAQPRRRRPKEVCKTHVRCSLSFVSGRRRGRAGDHYSEALDRDAEAPPNPRILWSRTISAARRCGSSAYM